jgi:hypothetical protein
MANRPMAYGLTGEIQRKVFIWKFSADCQEL